MSDTHLLGLSKRRKEVNLIKFFFTKRIVVIVRKKKLLKITYTHTMQNNPKTIFYIKKKQTTNKPNNEDVQNRKENKTNIFHYEMIRNLKIKKRNLK